MLRMAIAFAVTVAAVQPALAVPADFAAKADAILKEAFPADGPGAAAIVTQGGRTVYAKGQGLADVEAKRPITADTVFRLGSITKQFSAAVVLQLADEGKLSLDDPVSKYVPSLPQPGASATVRQLLNHTVGVQSYTGIPGWMTEANTSRPHSTAEMIALFKDLPSPSKPGEKWSYNNSGYVLVGAVIEAVTGKSWHQAIEERIAKPLGLRTIRFGEGPIPNMAAGYTMRPEGVRPAMKIHMSVPHAAGGLVGSVRDLATWGQALHHGKVVSAASYSAMTSPTKLPDGETVPYGFGIGQEEVRGLKGHAHSGGIFGFSTNSIYIPEKDLYVAVFVNSDQPSVSPGVIMQRLAALAAGDAYPAFKKSAAAPASIEPLLGLYKVKEGEAERRFFMRDGQLYTQRSGGEELKVHSAGGDRFFYGPETLTWFEVKRDPGGAHLLEMHHQGAHKAELSVRTGPVPPEPAAVQVPRAVLERYAGDYRLGPGLATVAVGEGGTLSATLPGQAPRALRPVSATEFRVQGVDATVAFEEEGGAVARLVIRQGGREMKAERVKPGS
jgi:CubicO group peptidase (beta-lactamase class C family)